MMKFLFSFLIVFPLILLSSCYTGECPGCGDIPIPVPTQKEKNYIDTLESRGFSNVELIIPVIGFKGYGMATYTVKLDCPFNLTESNKDSVIKVSDAIADELYSSVIEDSIIYDCNELFIQFSVKHSAIKKDIPILWQHYTKPSLERWNRFKVVKISPDKFQRQKW